MNTVGKFCPVCKEKLVKHETIGQLLVSPKVFRAPATTLGVEVNTCWVLYSTYDRERKRV